MVICSSSLTATQFGEPRVHESSLGSAGREKDLRVKAPCTYEPRSTLQKGAFHAGDMPAELSSYTCMYTQIHTFIHLLVVFI